jgi:hypothetical protein
MIVVSGIDETMKSLVNSRIRNVFTHITGLITQIQDIIHIVITCS